MNNTPETFIPATAITPARAERNRELLRQINAHHNPAPYTGPTVYPGGYIPTAGGGGSPGRPPTPCEGLHARVAEQQNTIETLRAGYREAIGVPESEHQRRRMEALATDLEAAMGRLAAAKALHQTWGDTDAADLDVQALWEDLGLILGTLGAGQ